MIHKLVKSIAIVYYRKEYNMGLFFYACAYDILDKTCFVLDADKFASECHAFSEPVLCGII